MVICPGINSTEKFIVKEQKYSIMSHHLKHRMRTALPCTDKNYTPGAIFQIYTMKRSTASLHFLLQYYTLPNVQTLRHTKTKHTML